MRRIETGPFKFEIGDEVVHRLGGWRGWVQENGWSDKLQATNPSWLQTGSQVHLCRIADADYVQRWVSEVYLDKISPLQLLAEQAE